MKHIYKFFTMVIVISVFALMIGLYSCTNINEVLADAKNNIDLRDYQGALDEILTLDDNDIIESDSLIQLLSTAYYGMSLTPKRNIAKDCYDMDFLPDGKKVVFTDGDCLKFYTYPDLVFDHDIKLPGFAYSADINKDGTKIAVAMADGTVLLYDIVSSQLLKTLKGHINQVRDVVFRDDECLFSCSNDQNVIMWDLKKESPLWRARFHSRNVKGLQISKDKTKLITASNDGSVCVINAASLDLSNEELRINHGENYVNDAAISDDNKIIVSVSGDSYAKIWDAKSGNVLKNIQLNEPLSSVDISDDGMLVIIGGCFHVFILDSERGTIINKIKVVNMPVWSVSFVDNNHFAFADNSRFWCGEILQKEKLTTAARKMQKK